MLYWGWGKMRRDLEKGEGAMNARWSFVSSLAVLAQALLIPQGSVSASGPPPHIKLHPAFTIEVVATTGTSRPTSVAFPRDGSAFAPGIYVSNTMIPEHQNDFIQRISPEGEVTSFANLPGESDPVDLEFPPVGSAFGDFLYVSANNRDGGRNGDFGGTIMRVDPEGNVTDLTPVGLQPEGKPLGLGEPCGMTFGPDGNIIVANSSDQPADIMKVDASGTVEIYLDDGLGRPGFSPMDVAFGGSGAYGNDLYFADFFTWSVYKGGTSARLSEPWARFPSLKHRTPVDGPRCLVFDPGGEFGGLLYVAVEDVIYQVLPTGEYAVFATGFGHIASGGLKFSPGRDALYVVDTEGRTVYRIARAVSQMETETVSITGRVTDQTGNPADRLYLSFLGAKRVETDKEGNYQLTYPKPISQEEVSVQVLLADSISPARYQSELKTVSVASGDRVIDLQIKLVPSEVWVGGLTFKYLDPDIRQYLNDDEDYQVGEYHGSDTPTYTYFGLGAVKHEYYFTNPGVESAKMNLSYKGKSYAPVRIFKRKDGGGEGETVGHLFIDQQGNVLVGEDARETIYVLCLGMHNFGELTTYRLDEEIRFYKSLRDLIRDMASKFDRMVQAGLALKGLETAISVYLDVAVGGDVAGAAMTTASSAIFFKQIIDRTDPSNTNKPQTLDDAARAVETVKLVKTWQGSAELLSKLNNLNRLKGAHMADVLDDLFPTWAALDPMELESQLDSMKLEAEDKKDILGLAYDTFQLVEQSDDHTQKAVAWKVQAAGLSAMVNEVIEVLEGVKNGVQSAAEAENIMVLKYTCSNMSLIYAQLLEDVIDYNEFRKHYTISGNIYRGLRGSAERLGVVSEHSTEGARQLISAFKGDGTEKNPGMAYYQMKGYYLDTDLAAYQTKWALERVKEKQPQTE
jgi:hypothetical protein